MGENSPSLVLGEGRSEHRVRRCPERSERRCPEFIEGRCPEFIEGRCPEFIEGVGAGCSIPTIRWHTRLWTSDLPKTTRF